MTTANEEFSDLMPHRIRVIGKPTKYNVYGRAVNIGGTREYRCLIDDSTSTIRNLDGTEISVSMTAYIAPVPIGETVPVDIEPDEKVEILSPRPQTRPIMLVERHYDSDKGIGQLHNIVLRFT